MGAFPSSAIFRSYVAKSEHWKKIGNRGGGAAPNTNHLQNWIQREDGAKLAFCDFRLWRLLDAGVKSLWNSLEVNVVINSHEIITNRRIFRSVDGVKVATLL